MSHLLPRHTEAAWSWIISTTNDTRDVRLLAAKEQFNLGCSSQKLTYRGRYFTDQLINVFVCDEMLTHTHTHTHTSMKGAVCMGKNSYTQQFRKRSQIRATNDLFV